MAQEETIKKTGATPIIEGDIGDGPALLGVVEPKLVLVKYRDGRDGEQGVRLGIVVGSELYFFDPHACKQKAQKWLSDKVIAALEK